MANRPSTTSRSSQATGRRSTATVKKPFPWGVVATSAVLGLLLIGILFYAISNQGSGFVNPLKKADSSIGGVKVTNGLSRNHVAGSVKYKTSPPDGGDHNAAWENCGVYTAAVPNEHAVHSLEHGAVWITYRPGLAADQIQKLASYATPGGYVLVSPYPGLDAPVSLQASGRQLKVQSAGDPRVAKFVKAYEQGPQTPEQGSACSGGTSATGTLADEKGASSSDGKMSPAPMSSKK